MARASATDNEMGTGQQTALRLLQVHGWVLGAVGCSCCRGRVFRCALFGAGYVDGYAAGKVGGLEMKKSQGCSRLYVTTILFITQKTQLQTYEEMSEKKTAPEILAWLRDQGSKQACEAAFQYLRETHRDEAGRFRLVNPESGGFMLNFTANGTKYKVLTPEDGIGMRRFSALRGYISRVGFDASLMEQFAQLQRIETAFNKAEYVKAAAGIHDMMQAINKANRAYPYAAEACCLFIVKDGESTKQVPTQAEIEAKILDWEEEEIHEQDFFFYCLTWATELNAALEGFSLLLQGRS